MKPETKTKTIQDIKTVLFLLLLLTVFSGNAREALARPLTPFFGGRITFKTKLVCFVPAPPPVFTIPIPFDFVVVSPPVEGRFYRLPFVVQQHKYPPESIFDNTLGTVIPGADKAFRAVCINGAALPEADGVIFHIGTGLLPVGTE